MNPTLENQTCFPSTLGERTNPTPILKPISVEYNALEPGTFTPFREDQSHDPSRSYAFTTDWLYSLGNRSF
jgi:hypothetical protein